MTPTATALLGFAAWSLLLVLGIALYRTFVAATTGKALNSFAATGADLPGFGQRLTRAHANTCEFLPVAGVVMLYAITSGQSTLTDGLALPFLAARLAQSAVHLASTATVAVLVRFLCFAAQVVIAGYWIVMLATAPAA